MKAQPVHPEIIFENLVRGFWNRADCIQQHNRLFVQAIFVWENRRGLYVDIPVTVLQIDAESTYNDNTYRALQHYQSFVRATGNEAFLLGPMGIVRTPKFLKDTVIRDLDGRRSWLYFEPFTPWRVAAVPEDKVFLAGDGSFVCPSLSSMLWSSV